MIGNDAADDSKPPIERTTGRQPPSVAPLDGSDRIEPVLQGEWERFFPRWSVEPSRGKPRSVPSVVSGWLLPGAETPRVAVSPLPDRQDGTLAISGVGGSGYSGPEHAGLWRRRDRRVTAIDEIRDYVREHRSGMLVDLVFAVVWVTMVTVVFDVVDGPRWAYYLFMFAGVVAYFGFFSSLEAVRDRS